MEREVEKGVRVHKSKQGSALFLYFVVVLCAQVCIPDEWTPMGAVDPLPSLCSSV